MSKVSVIIPSCNEIFLQKTIDSVLSAARGDIEVIAYLDGYWPVPPIKDDPKVTLIHDPVRRGMRAGINAAASIAKGEFLCKLDGHCLVADGFDLELQKECDKDWIVIPRRYSLDAEKWERTNLSKVRDAHYLSFPTAFDKPGDYLGFGMHVKDWYERGKQRKNHLLDDEMISQGSCWFMHKDYFWKFGGLQEEGYGQFIQESQQLMLRVWLSGGQVKVNKNTWYAHLWKGRKWGRMYELSRAESKVGEIYSAKFWYTNEWNQSWPKKIHNLDWLIDKFWPVPTWPDNFKNINIQWPDPPKIISVGSEDKMEEKSPQAFLDSKEIQQIMVKKNSANRDATVSFLMKKFGINRLPPVEKMPIEINLNRRFWGGLFNELGFNVGAEIGVYAGGNSEKLCRQNPGVKHFCIDPWLAYPEYVNHRIQQGLCSAEEEARQRLKDFNCVFIKKFSMDAVKEFEDNSLDYVYIDGNHDFLNVTQDIVEWEKKVRPGGIVSGHDFDKHRFSSRCHVLQVVKGYTEATGVYPWFITSKDCRLKDFDSDGDWMTSWMWVKA